MPGGEQVGGCRAPGVPDQDDRPPRVLVGGDAHQPAGVVHVVVPRVDSAALAFAEAVADTVERMNRVAVGREATRQPVVQTEVLASAVQKHDGGAGRPVR